jgi:HAD superfamily hydrolase (TIGR01509 family)
MGNFDWNKIPTPKMIVFDKDGTLGDCTPALQLWCQGMTSEVKRKCIDNGISRVKTEHIISNFHQAIGWDAAIDDVVPSAPLSAATWSEIVGVSAASLFDSGLNVDAHEVLLWHQNLGDIHAEDEPLVKNLPRLLAHFKHHGIIISICTSDDRASTNTCMRNWGISHIIDYSLCGDEVLHSKPSPQPLLELCRRAGVSPSECIVVGDTSSDTIMGYQAGARVVGVLTGSGTQEQLLETGADIVLPNIEYLKDLLLLSTKPSSQIKDRDVLVSLDENMSPAKVTAA